MTPPALSDLLLPVCRRCGTEQHAHETRGGRLVVVSTPCDCSPLWFLNPDHPDAPAEEHRIRDERKRAGLCVFCPNLVDGVVGKTLYCTGCRKKVLAAKDRKQKSRPETRRRRNGARRRLHQERLETDPAYRDSYQQRRRAEIPAEGTPEREAYLQYMADYNAGRRETRLAYMKRYNRFQEGERPTCAECGVAVAWTGKGKPRKYCPKHEPVTLSCRGCRKSFRWIPRGGHRPLYHDRRCRRRAARRRARVDATLESREQCACGCGRSVTGLRGRPKRHPECQRARREEADRTLRALFAEARGPGHMATVIGLSIAIVRADLERLGLVRREEDQVYARPEWWIQRLRTWGWPAWRAIAEAGLSRNAARVDELLDRFGIAELARPTRGRPIRFPQLQDRASVADLVRRHAGNFTAAAAELGCRPDRVAQAAHLFSLAPVRRRRSATRAASGGADRHAASTWRERIESGATPDDLVRESGLDEAEVLSRLRAEGLEDRAWVNLARRERSARTAA